MLRPKNTIKAPTIIPLPLQLPSAVTKSFQTCIGKKNCITCSARHRKETLVTTCLPAKYPSCPRILLEITLDMLEELGLAKVWHSISMRQEPARRFRDVPISSNGVPGATNQPNLQASGLFT